MCMQATVVRDSYKLFTISISGINFIADLCAYPMRSYSRISCEFVKFYRRSVAIFFSPRSDNAMNDSQLLKNLVKNHRSNFSKITQRICVRSRGKRLVRYCNSFENTAANSTSLRHLSPLFSTKICLNILDKPTPPPLRNIIAKSV